MVIKFPKSTNPIGISIWYTTFLNGYLFCALARAFLKIAREYKKTEADGGIWKNV